MAAHKGGMVYKYVETATPETDDLQCTPPNSRIAVTSAHAQLTETELYAVFSTFGTIEYIKILINKPVAFVKYDRASAAEAVVENAHTILVGGVNPKIFMAETRSEQGKQLMQAQSQDPEDFPPRSRLFAVLSSPDVSTQTLEQVFNAFPGFQSLRRSERKPVAFVKFALASEAAVAMETVMTNGHPEIRAVTVAEAKRAPGFGPPMGMAAPPMRLPRGAPPPYAVPGGSFGGPVGHMGRGTTPTERLFVVTGRNVGHDDLAAFLSQLPGFQSVDVKLTPQGTPKGFAYAAFSTVGAASAALPMVNGADLNGIELKAVFAEPQGLPGSRPLAPAMGMGMGMGLGMAPRMPLRGMYPAPRGMFRAPRGMFPAPQGPRFPPIARLAPGEVALNDDVPRHPPMGVDPDFPPGSRLFYVLSPNCAITEDGLISLFRRYAGMQYVQPQGGAKNYGFVKYDNPGSAQMAMHELNGKLLGAGSLKVVIALPTSEKGPRKRPREWEAQAPMPYQYQYGY